MARNLKQAEIITKTIYVCPYCGKEYSSEKEVVECLNQHNIVFEIFTYESSHDCWGCMTGSYEPTGVLFKSYKDAKDYVGKSEYKEIRIRELS